MNHILDILRGIVLKPALTAMARGLLEAAAFGALMFATDFVVDGLPEELKFATPAVVFIIRTLEGLADHIDPAKIRQNKVLNENLPESAARDTVAPQ